MRQVSSRRVTLCLIALGAAILISVFSLSRTAAAGSGQTPVRVDATYKISLNGFNLGSFHFKSDVGRTRYSLVTDVEISALLGVFKWKGVTETSGALEAKSLKPENFRFEYESSLKNGSVAMGFHDDHVDTVSVLPLTIETEDTIPLKREHLKGVYDPLSAILAITHSDAASPCGRKFSIFDGKQRFDLALKFARKEAVAGKPDETAIVCRVKYTPIAGYRPTAETEQLSTSSGIEIAFRMVPVAKLMLPQSVAVPTSVGHARIDLESVNVELPERGRVASAN